MRDRTNDEGFGGERQPPDSERLTGRTIASVGGLRHVGLQVFLGDLLGFGVTTLLFVGYGLDISLMALGLIFPLFFVPRRYRAFSTSAILVLMGMPVVLFALWVS